MANTLSSYDPLFYAMEGLIALEKALGLANRVHRGYDKSPRTKGSVIDIRIPSTFTAASAPATAADITASNVQINLDQWYEVKFKLTDKELSATQQTIIDEHIRPAAYALADNIDQAIAAQYVNIPWEEAAASTADVSDIVNCRKQLFDNGVPMNDGNLHFMVSPTIEAEFLQQSAFAQWSGAGATGEATQRTGTFGTRYGFEFFGNQNAPTHTAGALAAGTQLQLNADITAGDTSTVFKDSGASLTGTVKAGDTFVIAGHSQSYAITADATASSNLVSVAFTPAAVTDYSASDNVTEKQNSGEQSIAFHRNWLALAMAPLPELGNQLGARIASVPDPKTGLALRSRMYYVGNSSEVHVAMDVLYGVKVLDGNRAIRLQDA
jgi:hypothetical protein